MRSDFVENRAGRKLKTGSGNAEYSCFIPALTLNSEVVYIIPLKKLFFLKTFSSKQAIAKHRRRILPLTYTCIPNGNHD